LRLTSVVPGASQHGALRCLETDDKTVFKTEFQLKNNIFPGNFNIKE